MLWATSRRRDRHRRHPRAGHCRLRPSTPPAGNLIGRAVVMTVSAVGVGPEREIHLPVTCRRHSRRVNAWISIAGLAAVAALLLWLAVAMDRSAAFPNQPASSRSGSFTSRSSTCPRLVPVGGISLCTCRWSDCWQPGSGAPPGFRHRVCGRACLWRRVRGWLVAWCRGRRRIGWRVGFRWAGRGRVRRVPARMAVSSLRASWWYSGSSVSEGSDHLAFT